MAGEATIFSHQPAGDNKVSYHGSEILRLRFWSMFPPSQAPKG